KPSGSPEPLIVGNYVHSYFESKTAHKAFIANNIDDIISKSGKTKRQPKKSYKQADMMIQTLSNDDFFNEVYKGKKEVPVSGDIFGTQWKGKLDCLNVKGSYFCDIKTVDEIRKPHWNNVEHQHVSFVKDREYILQMAVYQELLRQKYGKTFEPFIFAVSKQDVPDRMAINIAQWKLDNALAQIKINIDHFDKVKNGQEEPTNCGKCEYCRMNKRLSGFTEEDDILEKEH
ncbi:PD-(D/E)XK nuclease-like domain-containing protein, partial [Paucilactobacillus kaifaensis]|uniref:PD-(D/E)XK nuclease-like domain-containing protein n=1 Tax=Paucilactobacillus kaifaensis TaxID=2559921 RepID=UPI0010F7F927